MSVGFNATTKQYGRPYLTIAEYKQAPTSIDYDNLVVGSTDPDVQDAELANVIARASSWIDTHCNQILSATNDTETMRARMSNDGTVRLHPRFNPIIAVTDLQYSWSANPQNLTSYPDCSYIWLEDQSLIVPFTGINLAFSSQGPLEFGLPATPRMPLYLQVSYVNGYANSVLSASASAGNSSVTLTDATGVVAGMQLQVYDSDSSELVTVANTYTFGSNTVPLVSPLLFAHGAGVSVSGLPPAIKQACILVTTAFIKQRGDASMTMQVSNFVQRSQPDDQNAQGDLNDAVELLKPYRRIR